MLSQPVGYAISALGYLAGTGQRCVLIREVSAATGVPAAYLAKLMNVLSHKGLILTQRGVGGGVCLSQTPEEISLFDVCSALDDPCIGNRCLFGNAECSPERACPAHPFWRYQREQFLTFLRQTTLREVAQHASITRGDWARDRFRRGPDWWPKIGAKRP